MSDRLLDEAGALELATQLNDVSRACHLMGYGRDSYDRFKGRYETDGDGAQHPRLRDYASAGSGLVFKAALIVSNEAVRLMEPGILGVLVVTSAF
jgi:hypothetical protein